MTEVSQHEQFEAAFLSVILMFVSVMKSSVTWDGLGSRSEELNIYIYIYDVSSCLRGMEGLGFQGKS